jgi:hypothetical protein
MFTFKKSAAALSVAACLGLSMPAFADNTTSNIIGTINANDYSQYTVTATDPKTGYSREISVSSDGGFRFSKLPTGEYDIVVAKNGTIVAQDKLRVSLGSNAAANFDFMSSDGTERIEVTGARFSAVDVSSTDSGLVMDEFELDRLPVARNLTAVALLAPGTVAGESGFGNTASFGGASVAENSCYINGLEVTNTRQGLGCGTVPFEFYKEFQVKTGGYSAQFGRTTGGVINSVTKSGTNEWEFAAVANWTPSGLQEKGSVSRGDGSTGKVFADERLDKQDFMDVAISASGPLIEDTLFIYALVNPRDSQNDFAFANGRKRTTPVNEFREREASGSDNMFWGVKLDWQIAEDHRLSYFAYSDRNDTTETIYDYDGNTGVISGDPEYNVRLRGGEAQSLTYTGYLTDDLSLSAMAGEVKTEYNTLKPGVDLSCPSVDDTRDVANPIVSCGQGGTVGSNNDKNKQYRVDIEYILGDHTIKAGFDKQERSSSRLDEPVGGHSYTYSTLIPTGTIQGIPYTNNTGANQDYVTDRIFAGGGGFSSDLTAYYIEDVWQATDNLVLNIGLRKDNFKGQGTTGKSLFDFKTDIAPRLGFSWDVNGDGDSKLFGTYGTYYLPIANNTIFRAASGVSDVTTHYTFTGSDATGSPTGIQPIAGNLTDSQAVNSVSTIPQKDIFVAQEANPFARDEYILGYEQVINDELSFSVTGIYREVTSVLDDYCGEFAYPYCLLVSPGDDATSFKDGFYYYGNGDPRNYRDFDLFDGEPDAGSLTTIPAADIGLPKGNNEYMALQSQFMYRADQFRMTFIYTWSRSTGNFEGAVKSDISQADAGITQDFDFPALMDGAQGYQANDRRHAFKMFGSYDITEDLTFGFNASLLSGKPLSTFGRGYITDDPDIYGSYGDTFYIYTGNCPDANNDGICQQTEKEFNFTPRGSAGRTSWTFNVDMSLAYKFAIEGIDMEASVDVFNVLNNQEVLSSNEHYEISEGSVSPWYGAAYSWQTPRYVRFGFEARF